LLTKFICYDDSQISEVTSLGPLPQLRVLRLNKNRIVTAPVVDVNRGLWARNFPHLEVLELGNNRVASIAALNLRGLMELRVLTLEGNDLTAVDGLAGLNNLQQLVLAKNKIKR
jgi:Leucine-rich repeat (LRR) protein